jgi:excisionase family DNA binding protein
MNPRHAAEPSRFMTSGEVASYLQIHLATLYKLLRTGRIRALKVGSDYRFDRDEVEKLVNDQQTKR